MKGFERFVSIFSFFMAMIISDSGHPYNKLIALGLLFFVLSNGK